MRNLFLASVAFVLAVIACEYYLNLIPTLRNQYYQEQQVSTNTSEIEIFDDMAASVSRSVVKKVLAIEQAEGVGARVRRSIGTPSLRNLSPFLMLDHFNLAPGSGFADHSHRGQATITYMIEGSSQHEDSEGHSGTIVPGGVQWMTAGRGVTHAEMPVHGPGLPNPMGLQLWVDLPKQHKLTKPTYQELGPEAIPSAFPEGKDGPSEIRVVSGKSYGVESPVKPLGGCWYFDIKLNKAGASVFQDIPSGWTSFVYILSGKLRVGTDSPVHDKWHTLVLSSKSEETGVALTGEEDGTRVILCAGEPLNQTVFQYGPFVMTTKEEIMQTLREYQMGINGFEKAHTWKSKIAESMRQRLGM